MVKFTDDLRARPDDEGTLLINSLEIPEPLQEILSRHRLRFSPLLEGIEDDLAEAITRAETESGEQQMDFGGVLIAEAGAGDRDSRIAIAKDLNSLELVEYVEVEALDNLPAPPGDISPVSSNLKAHQRYREGNPGINIDYAWDQGIRGAGVRLSNCEYAFNKQHEDLQDASIQSSGIPHSKAKQRYQYHGTGTMGVISAPDNGYGVSGMVPDSEARFHTEWPRKGYNRPSAIRNAIKRSRKGDVVMLEMQSSEFGPAELDRTVYNLVKMATRAGIVVVAAAGNGNNNLNGSKFRAYHRRANSGAIIVGAGSANKNHERLSFSSYGSRVNLQGWGSSVITTGVRGDFRKFGGDSRQFYGTFSGTSSATPIVASAVVALQSLAKTRYSVTLKPAEILRILESTGIPQTGGGGNIGPLPDVRAAFLELPNRLPPANPTIPDLTLDIPNRRVSLSWSSVDRAETYLIYRSNVWNGNRTLIGTTSDPSFIDTAPIAAGNNFYFIAARNSKGTTPHSAPKVAYLPSDVDISIGASDSSQRGEGEFNVTAINQTFTFRTRNRSRRNAIGRVQNKGTQVDDFVVIGSRQSRFFNVIYWRLIEGVWKNQTSGFLRGTDIFRLDVGQSSLVRAGIRANNRNSKRRRRIQTFRLDARSTTRLDRDVAAVRAIRIR